MSYTVWEYWSPIIRNEAAKQNDWQKYLQGLWHLDMIQRNIETYKIVFFNNYLMYKFTRTEFSWIEIVLGIHQMLL